MAVEDALKLDRDVFVALTIHHSFLPSADGVADVSV